MMKRKLKKMACKKLHERSEDEIATLIKYHLNDFKKANDQEGKLNVLHHIKMVLGEYLQ